MYVACDAVLASRPNYMTMTDFISLHHLGSITDPTVTIDEFFHAGIELPDIHILLASWRPCHSIASAELLSACSLRTFKTTTAATMATVTATAAATATAVLAAVTTIAAGKWWRRGLRGEG